MNEKKDWLIVCTFPGFEKKVINKLSRKKIEYYFPTRKAIQERFGRRKFLIQPLFTSFVFVKISVKDQKTLVKIDGVINLLYWLGKPVIITEEELCAIQQFLFEHIHISIQKIRVRPNEYVEVLSNSFFDKSGKEYSDKGTIKKIILPSLGYILCADRDSSGPGNGKFTFEEEKSFYYPLPGVN